MRGSELRLLHHERETVPGRERALERIRLMADDDDGGIRSEHFRGGQHVLDHRPSRDAVEYFRQR